jgi:hypothetical protein
MDLNIKALETCTGRSDILIGLTPFAFIISEVLEDLLEEHAAELYCGADVGEPGAGAPRGVGPGLPPH